MDLSINPSAPRVLFVTPECAPLAKTGGLGDVSAALPAALRALGVDVRVLLPGYAEVLHHDLGARTLAKLELLGNELRLLESRLPSGVPLYVIDCPSLYVRSGGPYQSAQGEDWPDNALRFGVLCATAARLGSPGTPLAWRPEIVHCNDWPAALAAAYLRFAAPPHAATILTVHNLAFQGNCEPEWVARLELPAENFSIEGLEFYGRMSFLKGGLAYADAIATVSPNYAREIQTEEFGGGMQGLLRQRREALSGILNGIDTALWNPASDRRIAQPYDAGKLELKTKNKRALQRHMRLHVDPGIALIGMVGRFTQQKGIDLVAAAADEIAALPAQLAMLGKGDREHENALLACAARHPGKIAVAVGFDEDLAHAIEAGADLFLMPSRFEPCGLNQMYSQRYGTPPVARATGGLIDTIVDGETGFLFARAKSTDMITALRRALETYADARRWRQIQRNGMARDFSWETAARRYTDLYAQAASLAPA